MNVFCLGSEQIDVLWPKYGHHLERYEADGHDYAGCIRRDLRDALKQLWGIQDGDSVLGVVVTKIIDTPRGEVCEVHACCGTSAGIGVSVNLLLPHIEEWAKDHGCVGMRIVGRKGWKKLLGDYRQTGVVMEKGLSNGI